MKDRIADIETMLVHIENDAPYLAGGAPTPLLAERGYMVSPVNNTIYPHALKSVLVKVTTENGMIGWGETYGICAPGVVGELIADIIGPYLIGRDPLCAQQLWDELYNLMRVRGYKGFYADALAAVDIALWDIAGRTFGVPVSTLLGGRQHRTVPAYVSGLSAPTLEEKLELAASWIEKGFRAFKLHATQSTHLERELAALRDRFGDSIELMVDLHWGYSFAEAARQLAKLSSQDISFAEAPVKPEDLRGLAALAASSSVPIAVGEEWRTVHEAAACVSSASIRMLQPEMGHTGITQFQRIAVLSESFNAQIAPHATIGSGIFMMASLQAASAASSLRFHEYHPAIFASYADYLEGEFDCCDGAFHPPSGPGLGVTPTPTLLQHARPM